MPARSRTVRHAAKPEVGCGRQRGLTAPCLWPFEVAGTDSPEIGASHWHRQAGRMGGKKELEMSRAGRRIIDRPRLTRLLSKSESRVMLLVAPAGYGKTTLAREWLRDRKHVWYQATPASSDVAALAPGLARTGHGVLSGVGDLVRGRLKTVSNAAAEAESLAADLAGDFADWPADARIVIDDYHLLAESAAAERFFEVFARATSVPLLITSRMRPAWV